MNKVLALAFLAAALYCSPAQAQTAPAKKAAATKTKTTVKATPKTSSKKGGAKKAGTVFICDGAGGYTYHSRRTCADLNKCKGRVLDMSKQDAINNWGRKQCKNCF